VGYGGISTQEMLDATRVPEGAVSHFVELHIEQGEHGGGAGGDRLEGPQERIRRSGRDDGPAGGPGRAGSVTTGCRLVRSHVTKGLEGVEEGFCVSHIPCCMEARPTVSTLSHLSSRNLRPAPPPSTPGSGPLLEREGLDIGVVTAIAAPAALEVLFVGDGGHAGGQLMPDR
jgi:hypothetical protein